MAQDPIKFDEIPSTIWLQTTKIKDHPYPSPSPPGACLRSSPCVRRRWAALLGLRLRWRTWEIKVQTSFFIPLKPLSSLVLNHHVVFIFCLCLPPEKKDTKDNNYTYWLKIKDQSISPVPPASGSLPPPGGVCLTWSAPCHLPLLRSLRPSSCAAAARNTLPRTLPCTSLWIMPDFAKRSARRRAKRWIVTS